MCKGRKDTGNETTYFDGITEKEMQQPPEILISVQTASDNDIPYHQLDQFGESSSSQIIESGSWTTPVNPTSNNVCFICNSSDNEPFKCLYSTVSQPSNTPIFDFVWEFLGGTPSARNDATDASRLKLEIVCAECLNMINRYDAACVAAKELKKRLNQKLTKTKSLRGKRQSDRAMENAGDKRTFDNFREYSSSMGSSCDKNEQSEIIDLSDED